MTGRGYSPIWASIIQNPWEEPKGQVICLVASNIFFFPSLPEIILPFDFQFFFQMKSIATKFIVDMPICPRCLHDVTTLMSNGPTMPKVASLKAVLWATWSVQSSVLGRERAIYGVYLLVIFFSGILGHSES